MLAAKGSMAALARWNKITHPAKISEWIVAKEGAQAQCRLGWVGSRNAAVGPHRVDFTRLYLEKGKQSRQNHGGCDEKNRLVREIIAAHPHAGRGESGADRGKGCIAAETGANRFPADKTKADGRHRGTQHTACACLRNSGSENDGEDRPCREGECAGAHGDDCQGCGSVGRSHGIHDRTTWDLAGEANQAADGQDETNIGLRPFLRGQINSDEGPKPSLHVGNKEHEPVKTTAACARRCGTQVFFWLAQGAILAESSVRMAFQIRHVAPRDSCFD